jgi:Cu+-exporting ATPase
VEAAQGSKAPIAALADRVSAVFVPVVVSIALVTLVVWIVVDPSTAGVATAVERFVAVLVIACPCALGLATPAAIAVATGRGAELGVLLRGGASLEAASRVNTVLLDKTGTLTEGAPRVTTIVALRGPEDELLSLAASIETRSEHPIARAIVDAATARALATRSVEHFQTTHGLGVEGRVDGHVIRIGSVEWHEEASIDTKGACAETQLVADAGATPVLVSIDGDLVGILAVADEPSGDAIAVAHALRAMGIELAMVSGDREEPATAVARKVGIDRVHARVRPEEKARLVEQERRRGRVVAMVGDGTNDAPALAAADVGIAIGHGAEVAVATADVALLRGGIGKLPTALALARATMRTIRQNLIWAFAYNVLGIPVAAGALYAWTGWTLSPVLASAAMSLSSVSVLLSSLRLRSFARM